PGSPSGAWRTQPRDDSNPAEGGALVRRSAPLLMWAALVAMVWTIRTDTAAAWRVPCDQVISRVNHEVGAERGGSADLSKLAKAMGTTTGWVEHCMTMYGRRQRRPEVESADRREERLEALEDEEPEEVAPEDVEEPGEHEHEVPYEERQ